MDTSQDSDANKLAWECCIENVMKILKRSIKSANYWGFREEFLEEIVKRIRRLQDA